MISFKIFITEAKRAPLYHATRSRHALNILQDGLDPNTAHEAKDLLKKGSNNRDYIKGVSVTRSLRYAKAFRADDGIIFELNQEAIQSRYRVVPINFWNHTMKKARLQHNNNTGIQSWNPANEFEEFIVTDKPIPPKYITAIHLFKGLTLDSKVDAFLTHVKETYPNIRIETYIL